MNLKKVFFCSIALFIVFTMVTGCSSLPKQFKQIKVSADYGGKPLSGEQEINNASDYIIIGSPMRSIVDESPTIIYGGNDPANGHKMIDASYTLREIKVKKVLKGDYKEDTINVEEYDAYINDNDVSTEPFVDVQGDNPVMLEGNDYIIYICKNKDKGSSRVDSNVDFKITSRFCGVQDISLYKGVKDNNEVKKIIADNIHSDEPNAKSIANEVYLKYKDQITQE